MKHFFTFLMIILFANSTYAQNNYDDLWKKVEEFESQGLPKSALEVVIQISNRANQDRNVSQQIKTQLFKGKYALILEEDAQLKIINEFRTIISQSNFPEKSIYENILANLYWQYFQQNRYRFYDRTHTSSKVDENDFQTWDLQTLFNEISMHFGNSLKNAEMLQRENLEQYNTILALKKDSKIYRPTLYDFLAHNALDFYKTDENSITKPSYKFEIDKTSYIEDAAAFAKIEVTSKDSTSLQLRALKLYQDLIKFHLKDQSSLALADVNIQRLLYVKQHASFNDKDEQFIKTLESESRRLSTHEVSGLYDFEIAKFYAQLGKTYNPINATETRWKIKEALQICESIISKFPKSKAAQKSTVLKEQLLQKSLRLVTESHVPINQDSRILVQYKNVDELNFKVYTISKKQLDKLTKTYRKEEQHALIKRLKVAKEWSNTLRNEKDYQQHTTEVLLPKLDNGYYVVFASPQNNSKNAFGYTTIQVTNLALVEKSDENHYIYQVIDRRDGQPIADADFTINYKENNTKGGTLKKVSNAKGEVFIERQSIGYWRLDIEVNYKTETVYFDNFYLNNYYKEDNNDDAVYRAFIFTDRSIYRPGQTVYFKGIVLQTENKKSSTYTNEEFYALLYNVNGEEIGRRELKTNAFGSVSGEFILPNGGLTGQYYISLLGKKKTLEFGNEAYFSVEEYKRPKFETSFNPVTETFKVNDSVTVKGKALAYAGSNITDAKVVYRVHRKVQYPDWYYWYRPWFNSEPQEIAHGETTTDNSGQFEITFKALPDLSVNKASLPIFRYEVTADVTDINGETRSATTIVNVGYHALTATLSIAPTIDKDKKDNTLTINTQNLNGEFVTAKGTIKLFKLKAPNAVLRPRPWRAPDYQEFSETDFKRLFPHDAYNEEHNPNTWKKDELVFETSFDTEKSKEINLGKIKKWSSGRYIIVLQSQDKFGQAVKSETRTTLYSTNDETLADKQLFSITTNQTQYALGDYAILKLASASTIKVTLDIEKNQKIVNTYVVTLNNTTKTLSIPVTKDDVGGFAVHYSFAAFNSFQSGTTSIVVPYPKTELEIETLTFRDKLQPGTDETWSFNIKGPKGDKISAELLASMYDASLDQFRTHQWYFNPLHKPTYRSHFYRNAGHSFGMVNFKMHTNYQRQFSYPYQGYDQLNWFGFNFGNVNRYRSKLYLANISERSDSFLMDEDAELDEVIVTAPGLAKEQNALGYAVSDTNFKDGDKQSVLGLLSDSEYEENVPETQQALNDNKTDFSGVSIRKNLQETAFFFPQLQTDNQGNVSFNFRTPEALTKWKVQLLAHTNALESTTTMLEAVTQKELMVIPNAPRFLREGDRITISTKIANLTDKELSGSVVLQLFDAINNNAVDIELSNNNNEQPFSVNANGNTQISWQLNIPNTVQAVQYKIIAKTEDFSDGEQNALPVLTNRMLVTESLPMWIRSNETKTFTLDKLKNTTSTTLKNHKLTLEMTSNPAWYAVQALPYLMEYPYDCNEQTFSRFYANALASHIANSNPRIKSVFDQWKNSDALLSNLEKNQELKSLLIQETPWLRDAQSETEQKKRIGLLFDLNKMNNELASALQKLKQNQMASGAWPWFNGGRENRFITQHIVTGFAHLERLNVEIDSAVDISEMLNKAIAYLDKEFIKEYKNLTKYNKDVDLSKDHLSASQLQFMYMRSFIPDTKKSKEVKDIIDYYLNQIKKYWLSRSLYSKGLMALIMHRTDDSEMASKILKSLKETSITSEELGMYWKENTSSWSWYQAPIETQALLIEAFSEIENDITTIDNLKIWLLKNKQTNRWKTTKATAEAVYALLLQGSNWLSVTDMVEVLVGGQEIASTKLNDVTVEAGTGYYKTSWLPSEIKPNMADIKLTKKGEGIAWGGLYWQYFEDLDKITSAETPLKLKKKLFLKTNTDLGEELSEITPETTLNVGNLLRVRIELRCDRAMEFVHMKDMRAAGLEPINVLSQYKWQDGLGYYESTKDAATNFFFDYLPKGVYVFEYDLRVNNSGNMSNGITTIQSMYAPEFSSHSEGIRVHVD